MAKLVYSYDDIDKGMQRVNEIRTQMDDTIKRMHGEVSPLLDFFTGSARGHYNTFIQRFEEEKVKLFNLLEEGRQSAIKHVNKVGNTEQDFASALGRTANQVGQ